MRALTAPAASPLLRRPCCVARSSNAPSHTHVRCLDVLQQLLPCSALEQVCLYNNAFDKLQLHTALLARGYPQPPVQRLQDDMNALPLIRSVVWGLCCVGVVLRGGCAAGGLCCGGVVLRRLSALALRFMQENDAQREEMSGGKTAGGRPGGAGAGAAGARKS